MEKRFYVGYNKMILDSSGEDESKQNLLFHFTTIEKLHLILSNYKLKASRITNTNDFREKEVYKLFLDGFLSDTPDSEKLKECQTVSFTRMMKKNGLWFYGFKHPRMWAQYANNSKGCCLVIDLEAFYKENPKKNSNYDVMNVCYKESSKIYKIDESIKAKLKDCKTKKDKLLKSFFRIKHKDWRDEHETRIVLFSKEDIFFNIKKSLKAIIFYEKINRECVLKLIEDDLINEIELYTLKKDDAGLCAIPKLTAINEIIEKIVDRFGNNNTMKTV